MDESLGLELTVSNSISPSKLYFSYLLVQDSSKLRIAMTEAIDSDTGCKVQELSVLSIPQPRTLSLDKHGRRTGICGDHIRRMLVHNGSALGIGRDVGIW